MKIVKREDIETEKWNALVKSGDGHFFSYSWYLDALADKWCIYSDENYSKGIALPYTEHLGVKTLYTPIFGRHTEWLGNDISTGELEKVLSDTFAIIDTSFSSPVLGDNHEKFVYQTIMPGDDLKIKKQAGRMLKKAQNEKYSVQKTEDFDAGIGIIRSELTGKFSGIDDSSVDRLKTLFLNAKKENVLMSFNIDGKSGGIVCLKNDKRMLYLKGTFPEDVKNAGGMYLAMEHAIQEAQKEGLIFDFGGSRIEGVRRFNLNLGGSDSVYYHYQRDNSPWWFRVLKRFRKLFKAN